MVQMRLSSPLFKSKTIPRKDKMPPYKMSRRDEEEEYKLYPELEYYSLHGPNDRLKPIDYSKSRHQYYTVFLPDHKLRHIDLRLSQHAAYTPRLPTEKTGQCLSEFPDGIMPRTNSIIRFNLEKRALREGLNYSSVQRKLQTDNQPSHVNYSIPLKIFGKTFPIVKRNWERPSSGWQSRLKERAQSAPPYSRPMMRGSSFKDHRGIVGGLHSEYSSQSELSSHHSLLPNYECECFIQEEPEHTEEEEHDPDRLSLQKYIKSIDKITEKSTIVAVARHFQTYKPAKSITLEEIQQIEELLEETGELKTLAVFVILERLSTRSELCDTLTKHFFVPVVRRWIALINDEECCGEILKPVTSFIQMITQTTSSDLWLDDVYKEQVIEQTTSKLMYDGTRAHYCTLLLRIFSDARCCASILANTALPECILLPQVKQSYWDESKDTVFLDEDIFLQEEILKIFCNIAHSSSFGRKVLICHGVIDTISRILAYASCPVQYQAALLCGALCDDVTGCDHVTSELTNLRADNATCMRHLGNLFLHSQCLRVKAAAGSAMARMFSTSDRRVASRGLTMVHEVLFSKPPVTRTRDRPSTAPPHKPSDRGVSICIVKDVMSKYMSICTTKGPFADSRFFRCRLMALEAVRALLHFPLKLEGRAVPFHADLAKLFFSVAGDRLFSDLMAIAEKHRYVKVLQDKIQKIQINLIKKTKRNARLSEILDVQLQEIESDNSVLKIPSRDFELARNELVYCELAIKSLSTILASATSSLIVTPLDSETQIESTRRYNSQYTTLQDSLYNKYAMSVLPGRQTPGAKCEEGGEEYLGFVRKLLSNHVVESLVPWLYCVYPPITEHVVRCMSSLFVFSSVHTLTVHCEEVPEPETWLHPSDISRYLRSSSVTPRHISCGERSVQLIGDPGSTSPLEKVIMIPGSSVVKPDIVVEQCTHHIGHLCSRLLTQNLLICNNHTVSQLAAQLLRDIARSVTREHLLCMVDDDLLERLTEYIILCNGDEARVVVALDILETLITFQPTLGKLYNSEGGLNRLVARLLSAGTPALKHKLLQIINSFPSDDRWCQFNKVDCLSDCHHLDVWHKVTNKWENQDNVSKLLSVEL